MSTAPVVKPDAINDVMERHPLSAAFGDMPAAEFFELVADIKRNGQICAIVRAADGRILDGWHRYRACVEAGIEPRFDRFDYVVEPAAENAGRTMTMTEFVCAQNAHRRHLTMTQKRSIIAELLKAEPSKSDRALAAMAKVDHKTVGTVRREAEATGEIPQLPQTTGRDGKSRAKPMRAAKQNPQPISQRCVDVGKRAAEAHAARQAKPAGKPAGRDDAAAQILSMLKKVQACDLGDAKGFVRQLDVEVARLQAQLGKEGSQDAVLH